MNCLVVKKIIKKCSKTGTVNILLTNEVIYVYVWKCSANIIFLQLHSQPAVTGWNDFMAVTDSDTDLIKILNHVSHGSRCT